MTAFWSSVPSIPWQKRWRHCRVEPSAAGAYTACPSFKETRVDSLKQRVLGAIVLVSLAIIFVPMLFNAPHPERIQQTVTIPPEPDVPGYQVTELKPPVLPAAPDQGQEPPAIVDETDSWPRESEPASNEAAEKAAGAVESVPTAMLEAQKPEETSPAGSQVAGTSGSEAASSDTDVKKDTRAQTAAQDQAFWKVKVGAFSKHDNAIRLRDQLRAQGIKAYTEPLVTRNKGTWLRVWAGPVRTREEAQALARRIDKTYRTQSRVIRSGS
ncbi:MAG: hypothetical protein D6758_13535 [Gammaproteobacteria bacterium]|nr:MAG: hypothetical protein D6758_13535 [Gammaproteobacteria bacterium]